MGALTILALPQKHLMALGHCLHQIKTQAVRETWACTWTWKFYTHRQQVSVSSSAKWKPYPSCSLKPGLRAGTKMGSCPCRCGSLSSGRSTGTRTANGQNQNQDNTGWMSAAAQVLVSNDFIPTTVYKTEAILTPSFMDEKTEAQRNDMVDLRTHSEESGRRQTRAQAPNCWGTCLPADSRPGALQKQRNVTESHTSLGPKLFVRTDRSRT